MRRFTLQLYAVGSGARFELEAIHLDSMATHIAGLIEQPVTIRHDSREFVVYAGNVLIKRERRISMLHYSVWDQERFCRDVVNEWRQVQGLPPLQAGDGNRLPRPVEESSDTTVGGDLTQPINRSG